MPKCAEQEQKDDQGKIQTFNTLCLPLRPSDILKTYLQEVGNPFFGAERPRNKDNHELVHLKEINVSAFYIVTTPYVCH